MKLPLRDYLALGLYAPAFAVRWFVRRNNHVRHQEERHNQMLNYLMLMGYKYDGYNLSAYDSERTNHVFWCGNWPYAYGDYAMVFDGAEGVEIYQYGLETTSLRNVILCRQMERSKWKNNSVVRPSTLVATMTAWVGYLAGWLGLKGR